MADLYYYVGIKECKGEWILLLDADDIPNDKLLKDLRKLAKDKYDGYRINRGNYLIRFFKKKGSYPTGIIHWVMMHKGKIKTLSDDYKIISKRNRTLEEEKRVMKKYAKIDALQTPLKVMMFEKIEKEKLHGPISFRNERYLIMLKIIRKSLFSFPISLSTINYNLFLFVFSIVILKDPIYSLYPLYILKNYLLRPKKCIIVSKLMYEKGVYNFLCLTSKEKILRISKKLNFSSNGMENSLKLIDFMLKRSLKNI